MNTKPGQKLDHPVHLRIGGQGLRKLLVLSGNGVALVDLLLLPPGPAPNQAKTLGDAANQAQCVALQPRTDALALFVFVKKFIHGNGYPDRAGRGFSD